MVRRYIEKRIEKESPATINRELAVLKHAFKLAMKSAPPKVHTAPLPLKEPAASTFQGIFFTTPKPPQSARCFCQP